METVSAGKFKTHCLSLLDKVAQSRQPIVITKYGKPVAKVVPFDEKKDVTQKPLKGSVVYMGDVISPLDENWEAERE